MASDRTMTMLSTVITSDHEYDKYESYDDTQTTVTSVSPSDDSLSPRSDDFTKRLIQEFGSSYREAISGSQNAMIPIFSSTPSGKEQGVFLAIDLGGSTLRIAVVEVADKHTRTVSEGSWQIKDDAKIIDGKFFDMISLRIREIIRGQRILSEHEPVHCGITWSFPLNQTKPNNGFMEDVSKGFQLTRYSKGKDLKTLLEMACRANGLDVCVDAIINDSTSVFIAGKFLHDSKIGMVLGTGTNSSLSVPSRLISDGKKIKMHDPDCVLNTELSFFGHGLQFLANKYDHEVDQRWSLDFNAASKPHMNSKEYGVFQPLELMTSGRYISELARLEIVDRADRGFLSLAVDSLREPYGLDAQYICDIHENDDFTAIEADFGLEFSASDRVEVEQLIAAIIDRAIFVLGAALSALVQLMLDSYDVSPTESINIGYVGSILQYFHSYREKLEMFISTQTDRVVKLVYVENSSVNGAAIAASVNNH